ncbi:hypothetical protein [Maricaulis sp.]|uniref:hypothetical protein n=1 Tax=Maricaulis sp. TaxID=1486257 RepID=UPI003A930641
MLLIAAALLLAVSAMHSIVGEIRLIRPLLRLDGLPVILGSPDMTRTTIRVAWHLTSLIWLGMAALLVRLQQTPMDFAACFLWVMAALFAASGAAALVASRGRHLSWVFFLPIAALCARFASGL